MPPAGFDATEYIDSCEAPHELSTAQINDVQQTRTFDRCLVGELKRRLHALLLFYSFFSRKLHPQPLDTSMPGSIGACRSLLTGMLDDYGASELACAIDEARQQQAPHPNAVRQVLERRREQRDQPPPLAITLPDNPKAKNAVVRPASLVWNAGVMYV